MRVLIAYGSKRGGTAGLAEMIGLELSTAGIDTTVQPARAVHGLDDFDAVVIAGALYANRWHKDAVEIRPAERRRFAREEGVARQQWPARRLCGQRRDSARQAGRCGQRGHRRPRAGDLRRPSRADCDGPGGQEDGQKPCR